MIITIDGPVASGKTSVARAVAHILGYTYLATGTLYRAVAYSLLEFYGYTNEQLCAPCNDHVDTIVAHLAYTIGPDGPCMAYQSLDITPYLKTPRIDHASSLLALTPYIHQVLCTFQRNFTRHKDIVVESRDAGTVVFPSATYKFFLTASSTARARRWQWDQERHGNMIDLNECERLITERDLRDTTRAISPLIAAPDAYVIDSTNMSFNEVVETIVSYVQSS